MYVYLLRSKSDPERYYTGITKDINNRLMSHNNGQVTHTSKYRPWELIVSEWFKERGKAQNFEKYLKSGSGRAFSKRHF
jgi:predicted GIY-YIG superfamily endonuclease